MGSLPLSPKQKAKQLKTLLEHAASRKKVMTAEQHAISKLAKRLTSINPQVPLAPVAEKARLMLANTQRTPKEIKAVLTDLLADENWGDSGKNLTVVVKFDGAEQRIEPVSLGGESEELIIDISEISAETAPIVPDEDVLGNLETELAPFYHKPENENKFEPAGPSDSDIYIPPLPDWPSDHELYMAVYPAYFRFYRHRIIDFEVIRNMKPEERSRLRIHPVMKPVGQSQADRNRLRDKAIFDRGREEALYRASGGLYRRTGQLTYLSM